MGQKINPIGFRLGVIKGWDSNWYGGKDFAEKLYEDQQIRKYVLARIPKGGIAKVIIERTLKRITLTIHTARPGVVIGKGGAEVDKLKEELKKITNKDIQINIFEIKRPEMDAKLVGESIAQQLQARISFRRAMKQAIAATMRVGAEGIKVARQMDTGMVAINRGIASDPAAPFGGVKESGLGREGGFEGIEEFLETKYISVPNWN